MSGTAGVKTAGAIWAVIIAVQILPYGEFFFASAAQYRFAILLIFWPGDGHMTRFFCMAFIAWIVVVAAMKLYGNNVERGMVVNTTGFIIHRISFYRDLISFHRIFFGIVFGISLIL